MFFFRFLIESFKFVKNNYTMEAITIKAYPRDFSQIEDIKAAMKA